MLVSNEVVYCWFCISSCDICYRSVSLFFNDTTTTEIYTYLHTLSLHDALPISRCAPRPRSTAPRWPCWSSTPSRTSPSRTCASCRPSARPAGPLSSPSTRSEEHTSELQSLMRISYAVFCLKKKKNHNTITTTHIKRTITTRLLRPPYTHK